MKAQRQPGAAKTNKVKTDIAVIIPVTERYDDIGALYEEYKRALDSSGHRYQFTYVLDGHFPAVLKQLEQLQSEGEPVHVLRLARWFGEATALTAGFENSSGGIVLTLPAYYQVDPSEIPLLLSELDRHDMVIARRYPRTDSLFNRSQTALFNWVLRAITGTSFHDLGCSVRAFRREIAADVPLYGDQHRFLPVLASRQGYRVKELDVSQSSKDKYTRIYAPGIYTRRALDMLTVFFLVRFTKKPLRFFGLIGTAIFTIGFLVTLYLVVQRLFFDVALADRPALLLSSLLVVLGVQLFALGLVGELIIFTHAKDIKEYKIERIVN